jgi:hypothetical protein
VTGKGDHMTSVLLQPGLRIVDGVGLATLTDHSPVIAAGYSAESLYVDNRYAVTRATVERSWAAGAPVMLNHEGIPSDAKNGYPAGERAAHQAVDAATRLGFRGESPLIFSGADEHFADLHGAGLDWHRALVDVLGPINWTGGSYGFKEMLELLSVQPWWPDDWPLWHWGGDGSFRYPWATIKQGPGPSYFDSTIGRQVDNNTLLKPMKFWSGYGADKLDPQEDDMTEAELRAIVDPQFKAIWDALTGPQPVKDPYGNDLSTVWAALYAADTLIRPDYLINRIADAVIAKLPPGQGGGLTEADVKRIVNSTHLTTD